MPTDMEKLGRIGVDRICNMCGELHSWFFMEIRYEGNDTWLLCGTCIRVLED